MNNLLFHFNTIGFFNKLKIFFAQYITKTFRLNKSNGNECDSIYLSCMNFFLLILKIN